MFSPSITEGLWLWQHCGRDGTGSWILSGYYGKSGSGIFCAASRISWEDPACGVSALLLDRGERRAAGADKIYPAAGRDFSGGWGLGKPGSGRHGRGQEKDGVDQKIVRGWGKWQHRSRLWMKEKRYSAGRLWRWYRRALRSVTGN